MLGLADRGAIEVNKRADLVIWDPDGEVIVDSDLTQHRHKVTPYDGMVLSGKVTHTILSGRPIFANGEMIHSSLGKSLLKN